MKTIALAAAFLALPGIASAQQSWSWSTTNNAGRTTGSIVSEPGGSTAIRDNAGRTTGRVSEMPGGGYRITDTQGRTTGYSQPMTGSRR